MKPRRDDRSRRYVIDVMQFLWPEPWRRTELAVLKLNSKKFEKSRVAYVFPNSRRPRIVVPVDTKGSDQMLRRLGKPRSLPKRALSEALVRLVSSPAFRYVPWPSLHMATDGPQDSIETYLQGELGTPVRVGVMLGTPRPNEKPVLQLFDAEGRTLGYAKVGHNRVTSGLVRREAQALSLLAKHELRSVRTPSLLHHGRWNSADVVVMTAMSSTSSAAGIAPDMELRAMQQVASVEGLRREVLERSSFWSRLGDDLRRVEEPTYAEPLMTAYYNVQRTSGSVEMDFGAWHGDWAPWNMASQGPVLEIWDWERFDADVPLGFDALHLLAQGVRPSGNDLRAQQAVFLSAAPRALAGFGVSPPARDLTLALYLLEIASRYALAGDDGRTRQTTTRLSWVVSLLERLTPNTAAL